MSKAVCSLNTNKNVGKFFNCQAQRVKGKSKAEIIIWRKVMKTLPN